MLRKDELTVQRCLVVPKPDDQWAVERAWQTRRSVSAVYRDGLALLKAQEPAAAVEPVVSTSGD
jgi:hypothetical protein